MNPAAQQASDLRFRFGQNWASYLSVVGEEHIAQATAKLAEFLGDLRGQSFLDVGSGSGIHSLAAVRLGAARVVSFDYDPESVECTREMKRRFAGQATWQIERGSVLDESYMRSLGQFDAVYSWGVLHHTGDMWKALDLVTIPAEGRLMIAIYSDQGAVSKVWRGLKRMYVRHPATRPAVTLASLATLWGPKLLLQPHHVVRDWRNWSQKRGMSPWHDIVDWAGGYPYEFSAPAKIVDFYGQRGFALVRSKKFGRIITCVEYVFSRSATPGR